MIHNNFFFNYAYELAKKALKKNLVPIGAVIVYKNEIISSAHNELGINHAEILCIQKAKKKNFTNHSIYVTLEPCEMCLYAIKLMKFQNIFFGAYRKSNCNHKNFSIGGIMEKKCSRLLRQFFQSKRL